MRDAADSERIRALARELGRSVSPGTRMYLTGGATAVLAGWRQSTVDIDVRAMIESGLVEPVRLQELFEGIEADLYRFPAVEPDGLRAAVESLSTGRLAP